MFISDKATSCRDLISHTSPGSKLAAAIVIGAALLVAVDVAIRPAEALSSVDVKEIESMLARPMSATPSGLQLIETDPAWFAARPHSQAASGTASQESKDIEASMVNGHIQAF